MNRNVAWCLLALLPIATLIYAFLALAENPAFHPLFLPRTDFWREYWFIIISAACFTSWLFFVVHSFTSKRYLWLLAIAVNLPIILAYWWYGSEKSN
ncbi:MAG: hypothetical protein ACI9JM_002935 [Halioglobus sp.]|jgi:hypothetical protein